MGNSILSWYEPLKSHCPAYTHKIFFYHASQPICVLGLCSLHSSFACMQAYSCLLLETKVCHLKWLSVCKVSLKDVHVLGMILNQHICETYLMTAATNPDLPLRQVNKSWNNDSSVGSYSSNMRKPYLPLLWTTFPLHTSNFVVLGLMPGVLTDVPVGANSARYL